MLELINELSKVAENKTLQHELSKEKIKKTIPFTKAMKGKKIEINLIKNVKGFYTEN